MTVHWIEDVDWKNTVLTQVRKYDMAQYPREKVENDRHRDIHSDQKWHSSLHPRHRLNYFPSAAKKPDLLEFLFPCFTRELREYPAAFSPWQHEYCEIQRKEVNVQLRLIIFSAAIGSDLIQWCKHVLKEQLMSAMQTTEL